MGNRGHFVSRRIGNGFRDRSFQENSSLPVPGVSRRLLLQMLRLVSRASFAWASAPFFAVRLRRDKLNRGMAILYRDMLLNILG